MTTLFTLSEQGRHTGSFSTSGVNRGFGREFGQRITKESHNENTERNTHTNSHVITQRHEISERYHPYVLIIKRKMRSRHKTE